MKKRKVVDVEKVYPKAELVKKLRRLADTLETNSKFSIQIAGEKICIPIIRR